MTCKILAFAGSSRQDSYNKKLVKIACEGARASGAEVTYIDLKDYPLPIFDEDLEKQEGLPKKAEELKKLFDTHDGLLIASPEYNSSVSGLLKNALDWVSRPVQGKSYLQEFKGKVVAIMSASPGGLGGIRGLVALRSILGNVGMIVLPDQLAVSNANEAFDEKGALKNANQQTQVKEIGASVANLLSKMQSKN